MTPRKIQINQIFYDGPETVFSVNADGTWTGDLQKAIGMIRADERAKVEREIAEWMREWPENNIDVRLAITADVAERLAESIERGDYRKPQEGG